MYLPVHPYFPSLFGQLGLGVANSRMVGRTTPAQYPSGEAIEPLFKAAKERANELAPESTTNKVRLVQSTPASTDTVIDKMRDNSKYASHTRVNQGDEHVGSEVEN